MYDRRTGDALYIEAADHECEDPQSLEWDFFDEMLPIYERAQKLIQQVRNQIEHK